MCGIVGYIGTQPASGILLEGLRKLEYRGYDSAGIATLFEGKIDCVRAKGKLHNLQTKLVGHDYPGWIGIGHTRWATHGKPEEHNAHPHLDMSRRVAVVQNGIIENYRELREDLKQKGYEFVTETDTEVIPNLVANQLDQMQANCELEQYLSPFTEAVRRAVHQLEGSFAVALICTDYPDEIVIARQESAPLVIGFGQGEFFCASDIPAILPHTQAVVTLETGEMATLTPLGVSVYDFEGTRLRKHPYLLSGVSTATEKHGFRHFMLKEIYEQPGVVRTCLDHYLNLDWVTDRSTNPINLGLPVGLYTNLEQVQIIACGTSWHASLIGKYLIEQLAGIPAQVQYASEFRYAPPPLTPNTLTIGVTQSGETADTISALNMEKQRRADLDDRFQPRLLGITNRMQSTLARLVDYAIDMHAGIEIGVAATKSFTAQLMAFYGLALDLAYRRQTLSIDRLEQIILQLRQLPGQIEAILETQEKQIEELAHEFSETQDFIFIGRGINFPIALEGALKLKEISYIHAEGYPAGEMKHGPIALLDEKVPVVAIAMPGSVYEKVLSNAQEAKARDARLIGVTPVNDPHATEIFDDVLTVPDVEELLSPILAVVPLQLLSYHIAAHRGLDVDQPRNLAKSVTVE
ncbi:glutamine--fructose-6-phosphate transaminase (isomerizing) [Thermocoleostomius sinensis]|jgi:glucosamine--fructose-6-phosphate aminotransferase (isomerizing)|uniref:Glutamine--fructose-6-phosphate aminotransferase [isomerizing] n=1 Tax=Thermocoleostomius sinensis A174 TaxID=2016057 RepID=A0A9E8ZG90_9CYAN|nr:glutamine--fructose-6-phosphate transaminase (isomerizing) [Thermocoleostomius sinensis]WAL61227.1 glutamine--fructose-6-phosphate transaminase (isomerizing) [Thermocoleostomius sinensis A174]